MKITFGKTIGSQSGSTLIEVLISSALLAILTVTSMQAFKYLALQQTRAAAGIAQDRFASAMVSATATYLMRDYSTDSLSLLDGSSVRVIDSKMGVKTKFEQSYQTLPIAFSNEEVSFSGVSGCTSACTGRMGRYIQNSPVDPALGVETTRIAHPDLGEHVREIVTLVIY